MTHTPGPWFPIGAEDGQATTRVLIGAPGRVVAEIITISRPESEWIANANLIAAAPRKAREHAEMLALLKKYYAIDHNVLLDEGFISEVRDLIAKVKGGGG